MSTLISDLVQVFFDDAQLLFQLLIDRTIRLFGQFFVDGPNLNHGIVGFSGLVAEFHGQFKLFLHIGKGHVFQAGIKLDLKRVRGGFAPNREPNLVLTGEGQRAIGGPRSPHNHTFKRTGAGVTQIPLVAIQTSGSGGHFGFRRAVVLVFVVCFGRVFWFIARKRLNQRPGSI